LESFSGLVYFADALGKLFDADFLCIRGLSPIVGVNAPSMIENHPGNDELEELENE
jgi:hypothetical protein